MNTKIEIGKNAKVSEAMKSAIEMYIRGESFEDIVKVNSKLSIRHTYFDGDRTEERWYIEQDLIDDDCYEGVNVSGDPKILGSKTLLLHGYSCDGSVHGDMLMEGTCKMIFVEDSETNNIIVFRDSVKVRPNSLEIQDFQTVSEWMI